MSLPAKLHLRPAALQGENPSEVGRTPWSAAGPPASLPQSPAKLRLRLAALWGRLATCGGLPIRPPLAPGNRSAPMAVAPSELR
jgi:hypothetical protein